MKEISIQDKAFIIPENYNELTLNQLKKVCRLHIDNSPLNQLDSLYYLLGIRWYSISDLKKWNMVRRLPAEWLHTLLTDRTIFGWIFDKSKLTVYHLKKFRIGIRTYHGPVGNILKLNAVEITFGYEFFKSYSERKDAASINNLIALIYRKRNPFAWINQFFYGYTGDKRLPLNEFTMLKRVKVVEKLPAETKVLIFLQFAGKWEEFQNMERNKLIFPKFNEVNDQKKHDPLAWEKIMMKMAEQGTFGPLDKVYKMDKDRFFLCMVKNVEEYLQMKDRLNSKK